MKRVRSILITFDFELKSHEIPGFRGAIAEKAGLENELFHQHGKDGKLLYQYPKIQYKTIRKQSAILGLDEGVDNLHHLFSSPDWQIEVSGRKDKLTIDELRLKWVTLQVWDKHFKYKLNRWLALNSKNYLTYKKLPLEERRPFLEKILVANILAMAKGLNWEVDKAIEVQILEYESFGTTTLKKTKMMAFEVVFTTNVSLPNYMGLGKSTSLGFGNVKQIHKPINKDNV